MSLVNTITPPQIISTDVDISRFTLEALQQMRDYFPGHDDTELVR